MMHQHNLKSQLLRKKKHDETQEGKHEIETKNNNKEQPKDKHTINDKKDEKNDTSEKEQKETQTPTPSKHVQTRKSRVAQEFSDILFFKSTKFSSFSKSIQTLRPWEMHSFSEGKAIKFSHTMRDLFTEYNKKCMTRVYPKGTRFDSSNYSPLQLWCAGAQLVALNYQTYDFPMLLNRTMFLPNNGCGYLLKPNSMRGLPPEPLKKFSLELITLVIPEILKSKPAIEITIIGIPNSSDNKVVKSSAGRFFSATDHEPQIWRERFFFDVTSQFDILMIDVSAHDKLTFIAPISCIHEGYQRFSLYKKKEKEMQTVVGNLFVHTKFFLEQELQEEIQQEQSGLVTIREKIRSLGLPPLPRPQPLKETIQIGDDLTPRDSTVQESQESQEERESQEQQPESQEQHKSQESRQVNPNVISITVT